MSAPVTCVITCFNDVETLEATVGSVLHQSLPVSEIIIADDGSTDGTRSLISELSQAHSTIRPILRERNLGVAANRDLAIRAASQPFVTHLDSDDLFAPRKIAAEWTALGGRSDRVAFSYVAKIWPGRFWRNRILDPAETVNDSVKALEKLGTRAGAIPRDMLLARSLFEEVGGFTHGVPLYEDWEFKMRLAKRGVYWAHSGVLGTLYLQHDQGLSKADREQHIEWRRKARRTACPNISINANDAVVEARYKRYLRGSFIYQSLLERLRILMHARELWKATRKVSNRPRETLDSHSSVENRK